MPPVSAPAPPRLPGKVLVRRVHAYVPRTLLAPRPALTRVEWVGRLLRRYPRAIRKGLRHLLAEGPGQTWTKARTRATLERWSTAHGLFAAVGIVVEGSPGGPSPGATVMCWSWQGPVDADLHLVSPDQCVPVPDLAPEYALAPVLGWLASVLRRMSASPVSCRLVGLDPRLEEPLATLLGVQMPGRARVVVGCGPGMAASPAPGESRVFLSAQRAVAPLVEETAGVWVCRLPDPAHYFLDPYGPGAPEWPEPFGRAAVVEALELLAARRRARAAVPAGGAEPVLSGPPERGEPRLAWTLTRATPRPRAGSALRVSCLGAGNYVRAVLLHQLRRHVPVLVRGVMDVRPEVAAVQARALGAAFCTTDPAAVVDDPATDLVLVASDHASHADYAVAALRAGKAVHLEKPPAVEPEQLDRLLACVRALDRPRLHLGYTRPFAPATVDLQRQLEGVSGPTTVTCAVQGYRLPRAHWYRWPGQGTRIAGNLVHWIDLGYRLAGRPLPAWVELSGLRDRAAPTDDGLVLAVGFESGARLSITFWSARDEADGVRERVEVRRGDLVADIDDFRSLRVRLGERAERRRYRRDTGAAGAMAALARSVRDPAWGPEATRDLARTCAIQFAAQAALAAGGGRQAVAAFLPRDAR